MIKHTVCLRSIIRDDVYADGDFFVAFLLFPLWFLVSFALFVPFVRCLARDAGDAVRS